MQKQCYKHTDMKENRQACHFVYNCMYIRHFYAAHILDEPYWTAFENIFQRHSCLRKPIEASIKKEILLIPLNSNNFCV